MFIVTSQDAAAIRAAYERGGERRAMDELRRRFPGLRLAGAADVQPSGVADRPDTMPEPPRRPMG